MLPWFSPFETKKNTSDRRGGLSHGEGLDFAIARVAWAARAEGWLNRKLEGGCQQYDTTYL